MCFLYVINKKKTTNYIYFASKAFSVCQTVFIIKLESKFTIYTKKNYDMK